MILQSSINDILGYTLVNTEKLTITVYSLLMAVMIFLATWIFLWILKRVFKRTIYRRSIEPGKGYTVYQLIKYVVWIIAVFLVLDTLGVKITLLVAGSAALLVGIGLGVQQVFKDIISGFFLLFEGHLKVGDVVELEGVVGIVKEIGFRTTMIESRDNIILIIPNSKFIEENVINWSHIEKKTRFHVNVGVAYGSDVEKVKRILMESALEHKDITQDPEPFVRFNDFGNSSLDFQLFFWTNNAFRVENLKSDLRFAIDRKFRENNVTIPFPQRDVHIKK
ncbi:MAG TPA: mechanosensitive ion channel domain-containing protein [Bacteroidales bacterium]|nr:mechanosensitive ion channel domain-containing protein [Bacteroidales bacterium]